MSTCNKKVDSSVDSDADFFKPEVLDFISQLECIFFYLNLYDFKLCNFLIFGFLFSLYAWNSSSDVTTKIHCRFDGREKAGCHTETRAATYESTALMNVSICGLFIYICYQIGLHIITSIDMHALHNRIRWFFPIFCLNKYSFSKSAKCLLCECRRANCVLISYIFFQLQL